MGSLDSSGQKGFRLLKGDDDRQTSENLARMAGGRADEQVPAMSVERNPKAKLEAEEEIRRQIREAGCVCEPIKLDKHTVMLDSGEEVLHVCIFHKEHCPLAEWSRE